jgi:hypothetical protein
MRRFEARDTWGVIPVRDLSPLAVQTARDAMKDRPVMANQMLSVGRTIWDWAIPLDLAKANPFDKVKDLDIPDRGHVPWPSWVIDYVRSQAWPDLVRMERLGIMTCQRGSDLIRMGPEHRDGNGNLVPAKENPLASPCLPHSAGHVRRMRDRSLGRDAGDVHEQPLAEAHRSLPRGPVPLFSEARAVHRRRSARALGTLARRHRGRSPHLPQMEGMGRRPGQEI